VQGSKEPIKVDITMRLDVYQHVQKDIDDIESIVSGAKPVDKEKSAAKDNQSLLGCFLTNAYAKEGLSPDVEQAALSRRGRLSDLASWESKGVIGENKLGLVEIRNAGTADSSVGQLVQAENSNRMVIYQSIAQKNSTSVEEVQKMYAQRLQNDAPSGTPIEVFDQSTGKYIWKIK
jgi:uncharacterized protein YdbL (DUF1318 family)